MPILPSGLHSVNEFLPQRFHASYRLLQSHRTHRLPLEPDDDITQQALSYPLGPHFRDYCSSLFNITQAVCCGGRQRVPSRNMAQQQINNLRATAIMAILRRALLPRFTRS